MNPESAAEVHFLLEGCENSPVLIVAELARERVERFLPLRIFILSGAKKGRDERAGVSRKPGVAARAAAVVGWRSTPSLFETDLGEVGRKEMERARRRLCGRPAEGYAGCCGAAQGMDLRKIFGRIQALMLGIIRTDNVVAPPEHGRSISDSVSDARLTVVARVSCLANLEVPEAFAPPTLGFLKPSLVSETR